MMDTKELWALVMAAERANIPFVVLPTLRVNSLLRENKSLKEKLAAMEVPREG